MDVEIEPFIAEKESHFQTCRFTKLDLHNTRAVPSPGRTAYCSPGGWHNLAPADTDGYRSMLP